MYLAFLIQHSLQQFLLELETVGVPPNPPHNASYGGKSEFAMNVFGDSTFPFYLQPHHHPEPVFRPAGTV